MSRTAIIVHVFYPGLWPELRACIRNVSEPHDVFVTFSDASRAWLSSALEAIGK